MNIDVREYLRINPISVHELTLSGDGKDCFLYFPEDGEGYEVQTQDQIFHEIKDAIFQNLIDSNGKLRVTIVNGIVQWSDSIHLTNIQFTRYVRRHICDSTNPFLYVWNTLKADIEARLTRLESGLSQKIDDLRKNGVLNYAGAVELQSPRFDLQSVASGFSFSNGFIWCHGKGKPQITGVDNVELGDQPLKHKHVDTKSETLTIPFTEKKGGGKLIGEFCVGNKVLVSSSNEFHISQDTLLHQYRAASNTIGFTYPLYGQNVLDWRTPGKTHNNVPPCCNIMVKYKPSTRSVELPAPEKASYEPQLKMETRDDSPEKLGSVIEAKYDQATVSELDEFTKSCFTDGDLLLRISSGDSLDGEFTLMKQTLKILLDIFTDTTEQQLCMKVGDTTYSLGELLMPKLDKELVIKSEFLFWYKTCMQRLDEINNKIKTINELIQSVPPLPYVGKIIISTTDDVESKVIKHYGGKRWRRIVNFLRGVNGNDETLGKKFGEEYVCLRESNIPIHTHDMLKKGVLAEPPENQTSDEKAAWMCKQRGGSDKKIVSVDKSTDGAKQVNGVSNLQMGYQISPLEYGSKNYATIPHNNMPPYREVYIWECLKITKYEESLVGRPGEYNIVYNMNGVGTKPATAWNTYMVENLPYTPPNADDASNYHFTNWTPTRIPITARGTFTFKANWHSVVTFDANGGTLQGVQSVNVPKGQKIGDFPSATGPDTEEVTYNLAGWYGNRNGTGTQYTSQSVVAGDITLYAKWVEAQPEPKKYTVKFNGNGGTSNGNSVVQYADQSEGTTLTVPTFTKAKHTFTNWRPEISGRTVVVTKDQTYVAMWTAMKYTVTFNSNGGIFTSSQQSGTQTVQLEEGESINAPIVERDYYDFTQWSPAIPSTMPANNLTFAAQWRKKRYTATFNANGGSGGGSITQEWGTTLTPPANPSRPGYAFNGWDTAVPATMPQRNTTYNATWREVSYTITFRNNGGTPSSSTKSGLKYRVAVGTLPTAPTRTNYIFLGWFNKVSSAALTAETLYPFESDSTYTASWILNRFTATFKGNGGTPASQTRQYKYMDVFGTLPTVSRTGYTFKRWEDTNHVEVTSASKYNYLQDTQYNAIWQPISYTITYNMNGHGSIPSSAKRTYTIETGAYAPPAPAAVSGWRFLGWTPASIPANSTGTKTFTASWEQTTITVTYYKNY